MAILSHNRMRGYPGYIDFHKALSRLQSPLQANRLKTGIALTFQSESINF